MIRRADIYLFKGRTGCVDLKNGWMYLSLIIYLGNGGGTLYIYIYIYIIFKKKIVLNPLQYKFAHLHHEPGPILFFKAQLKLQKKKKKCPKENFGL